MILLEFTHFYSQVWKFRLMNTFIQLWTLSCLSKVISPPKQIKNKGQSLIQHSYHTKNILPILYNFTTFDFLYNRFLFILSKVFRLRIAQAPVLFSHSMNKPNIFLFIGHTKHIGVYHAKLNKVKSLINLRSRGCILDEYLYRPPTRGQMNWGDGRSLRWSPAPGGASQRKLCPLHLRLLQHTHPGS